MIVDFSGVPFLDSTGAHMIEGIAHKAHKHGVALWLTGASRDIRRVFLTHGLRKPLVRYATTIDEALAALQQSESSDQAADWPGRSARTVTAVTARA